MPLGNVILTWNDVAVTPLGDPTLAPGMFVVTVNPDWKPLPVTVTVVAEPGTRGGSTECTLGRGLTVKQPVQVLDPPGVVTVTSTAPGVALEATFTRTRSSV